MRYTLLTITLSAMALFILPNVVLSQDSDAALFNDGNLLINEKNYRKALGVWQKLLERDAENSNVNYKVGLCVFNTSSHKDKAIPYFEKAAEKISKNYDPFSSSEKSAPIETQYYLGRSYHIHNQLDKATESYEYFIAETPKHKLVENAKRQIEMCKTAKELMADPLNIHVTNLGDKVNSPYPDYGPVVALDEKSIFYTSRRLRKDSSNYYMREKSDGHFYEDVYVSHKDENGNWMEPEVVNFSRKEDHDGTIGISADGQVLYVYRNDKGDGNIYESDFDDEENIWMEPGRILGSHINTKSHETHMSITANAMVMYFTSDREGSIGGKDIYRVVMMPDDDWSEAFNLGPTINTPYDEEGPFIHPDGKTLYFASEGHNSMGGFDIFKTELTDSGWSAPVNIGYPINTTEDDIFFVISVDGKRAYLSSDKKTGYGETDIYMIDNVGAIERKLTLVKGFLENPKNGEFPNNITVIVTNKETGELMQKVKPQPRNGSFIFLVLPGVEYHLSYLMGETEFNSTDEFIPYGTEYDGIDDELYLLDAIDLGGPKKEKEITPKQEETPKTQELNEAPPEEAPPTTPADPVEQLPKGEITYKVQVGAYSRSNPKNLSSLFDNIGGIEQREQGDIIILTTKKSFSVYSEAAAHRDEVRAAGVDDAWVVIYNGDRKISVSEAKQLR